jgi:VWFA-related protein
VAASTAVAVEGRTDIQVVAIGGGYPGGGRRRTEDEGENGKKTLERISAETGGRFFEVSKKETVDDIYKQIEEDVRNQYSIGYTPSPADSSGGYHKIHLTLKDKDLAVAARAGYYSTP